MEKAENIRISLIQTSLFWEDRKQNINHLEGLIGGLKDRTDIIVFPEMFTSGFSLDTTKEVDTMGGETLAWMKKMASDLNAVLCGSLRISEEGKFYNRFVWVQADGEIKHYDKRHLFGFANEDDHFTRGEEKLIINYRGWKILPLVCYDLRFPVWSKNRLVNGEAEYDLLIYTANWPKVRNHVWKNLLIARALENQVFVAGVNRVGLDNNDLEYSGDSSIISPYGGYLSEAQPEHEDIIHSELDYNLLNDFRKKFPVLKDADNFEIS